MGQIRLGRHLAILDSTTPASYWVANRHIGWEQANYGQMRDGDQIVI